MRNIVIDKRYKILKKCGAGATGNVYKVRDLKDKKILALKLLSKQKTSSDAVRRFKREFRLLTQLCHPNLCSVYDFGTLKDGRSYFTMEYISGKNISKAAKGLSHEKIYAWIVQLCRALEYIHAKGLIHYDIKPANVLIQESSDGTDNVVVKLTDFCLAGEQRIKGGAIIKGTFPYIAPEVIEGLAVDHRADLYSLGILLYEIFAPKPFQEERESFVTLLQQRIQRGLTLPAKVIDMPEGLQQILLRLLAFEPAARFSRANEVIKRINQFSRSKFAFETERTVEGYLLSSRFVGREKEMEGLQSLYEQACKGIGRIVLVTGDAGIGKSRLLKEFKIFTQLQRSHTFIGYAYKDKIGPLEPFYDIFSELINYITDGSVLKTSLAVLFKIFPDLSNGHLRKNLPRLVPLGPQQEKLRNFEALLAVIKYCGKNLGELIILLEDLHWADDLSIQFLEYLGRNIADSNIFICGTAREHELKENQTLQKMINNLRNEGCFNQVELGPLKLKSLHSFLDSTITPESNSLDLAKYLKKKTGGNPFFVEEIMRTVLQKRKVSIGEKIDIAHFQKVSIPNTIKDAILKRLKDLDRISQNVVKFTAVLFKGFNYDMMKRLTGLNDTELSKALWELKNRQILVEEGNNYRFYHATLREALNKRMAYREKQKLYYQSGKALELMYKRNTEGVVEDLAYYFIHAKEHKKGVRYGLQAARKSSKRYAIEQAIQFYKGVLGLSGDKNKKRRFHILKELAQLEDLGGYYDDAIEHYKKVLNLNIGTIYKKIKTYLVVGDIYVRKGEYSKALHVYQRVAKLLKDTQRGRSIILLEAYTRVKMCLTYLAMGDYKNASNINLDDLKFPKKGLQGKGAMQWQSDIYHYLGVIENLKGEFGDKVEYDKAIFYYKQAHKYYKKTNNVYIVAGILNNLGINYFHNFDFQKAIDYYKRAVQLSEKIGYQYAVAAGFSNLGQIFKKKGYYSKALEYLQRSVSISKKIGDRTIIGISHSEMADCFLLLCNYEKAKEYYETMLKTFDASGQKEKKAYSIMGLGNVFQKTGDYTRALRFHRKSLKISKDIGHRVDIANSFIRIGSIFIEIGEFSRAKRYIEDALKIATELELKDLEIECYTALCSINIMIKDYSVANNYYKKGITLTKKYGLKRHSLQFFLLLSEIHYRETKYLEGTDLASRAIKLAKEIGTKDLYVEALLIKTKNGMGMDVLSKREITEIMDEAVKIAEEINCPEVLWKAYFEYGSILQNNREYFKALDYYEKCIEILTNVSSNIENKSDEERYLNRFDRRAVFAAVDMTEKMI